jgi:uncharacterized RDD family membrane protein YckC
VLVSPPRPGPDGIVTPDAVALDLEVATVGSRGIAYLVDLTVLGTGLVLLGLAEATLDLGGPGVPGWAGVALVLLLLFAWQFGYPIGFETLWRGRTPGKALLGLRVVTVEGAPVGVRHATIRAVVGLLELTGTLGAVAILTSLVSARHQRLGDLAAGTLVIRERRARSTPEAHRFLPPPGLAGYAAQLDPSLLGPAEYAAVRDLLLRAPTLPPEVRDRLARQLATAVGARVTPPPPPGIAAEDWLRCVAAAVQARRTGGCPSRRPGCPSRRLGCPSRRRRQVTSLLRRPPGGRRAGSPRRAETDRVRR